MRAGRSATAGTRYGIRAIAIFFFARVIRAAIVGSVTRKDRATSRVESPQSSRNVNATCDSLDSDGWQQVKISRSRSSGKPPPAGRSGSTSSPTSSGSLRRSVCSRRITSIARRRATVVSQEPGARGMPSAGQLASAWA